MKKEYIKPELMAFVISETAPLLLRTSIQIYDDDYYDEDDDDIEDL